MTPSVPRIIELVAELHFRSLHYNHVHPITVTGTGPGRSASPFRDTALTTELFLNYSEVGVTLAMSLTTSTTYNKLVLTLVFNCNNRTALVSADRP